MQFQTVVVSLALAPCGHNFVLLQVLLWLEIQQLVNWSGTHHVRPKRFYQPETTEEVEEIVQESHEQGTDE